MRRLYIENALMENCSRKKCATLKLVISVCRRCYYFLQKICSIRDTFDRKSLIELVRVMILSRLDYCNSLYYRLPVYNIQKLQRMNSACLIFRLSPGSSTTNYIKLLLSLPMKQHVLYKFLLFGHRLVHHPWENFRVSWRITFPK